MCINNMDKITLEDCYKYYNAGIVITINDGKIISIVSEKEEK